MNGYHILKLSYFARTPTWLKPGDEIVLEDRLWSGTPSINMCQAAGDKGVEVVAKERTDPFSSGKGETSLVITRVCCLTVPARPSPPSLVASLPETEGGSGGSDKRLTTVVIVGVLLVLAGGALGGTRHAAARRRE